MRIAAGILMVLGGVGILTLAGCYLTEYFTYYWWRLVIEPFLLFFLAIPGVLVLAGGILALKRKLWGFCLASSLLMVWAILPLVFVCVRRSEWES
ncbi:MAG: hypothetical protein R6V59_05230 [Dehalococcoidia bacterium]